jgi:hypothetical protein
MIAPARNVWLLAASQALALSAVVLSMTLAGILGATMAPDKGWATLADRRDGGGHRNRVDPRVAADAAPRLARRVSCRRGSRC